MDFSEKARDLVREQIFEWDLASKNYEGLKKVKVKTFYFNDYHIDIQFNPERIISSAAKVDFQSIEARPCFLCQKNLPSQQRGLSFNDEYVLLVNPFPIFPEHLTIPHIVHTYQKIKSNFESMLGIAVHLKDFVVFYNGAKCGASAPDHLHFQAGVKGSLPIEKDFYNEKCCTEVRQLNNVIISHWPNYQRGIITLSSIDKQCLTDCFYQIYDQLLANQTDDTEPMLNILTTFEDEKWIVHIFPRVLHRPLQYFQTGENQIILSPASVDMGGVLITPREEDFIKISAADVKDILKQVCMKSQDVEALINRL